MREIKIPYSTIEKWRENGVGHSLNIPVCVGWKELQLTEEQILANAFAHARGQKKPYDDNSIFYIVIDGRRPNEPDS